MNNPFYVDAARLRNKAIEIGLIELNPVVIGTLETPTNQSECAIAIGEYAGLYNQAEYKR